MTTRHQQGYIWRVGKSWYGRWYQNEIESGAMVRRQHSEKLCEYGDQYRTKKDVRPVLDDKLAPINAGTATAESTMTIEEYAETFFFPHIESEAAKPEGEFKPSTVNGYKSLFRMYLKPRVTKVALRDFTCGKATKLLIDLHSSKGLKGKGLSRKSLRHCKGLLQTIFMHAKRNDVIAGENPVRDAKIPSAAKKAGKTHAYTVQETADLLHALDGVAKTSVALMFFCGLRPGEARGAKWTDYDEEKRTLKIERSVWRKHETLPKTEDSVALVPVCAALRQILADMPQSSKYILATPSGKPVDLHNLAARTIAPALKKCGACGKPKHDPTDHAFKQLPKWQGFYALRRGIGTAVTDSDTALAAKSLLRHASIATTQQHYIKSVDAAAVRGVDKVSSLFDNENGSSRPH